MKEWLKYPKLNTKVSLVWNLRLIKDNYGNHRLHSSLIIIWENNPFL